MVYDKMPISEEIGMRTDGITQTHTHTYPNDFRKDMGVIS